MPATLMVRVIAPGTPADEAFATLLGDATHCLPAAEHEFYVFLRDPDLEPDTGEAMVTQKLDTEHPNWREHLEVEAVPV